MSQSDLDSLYKRASAQDSARPSAAVRRAILDHARRLADETQGKPAGAGDDQQRSGERGRIERAAPSRLSRWIARWPQMRWQIAVPVAAAALAVILLQPQLRSTLLAPARLRPSAPPASTASRPAPVPMAPLVVNSPLAPNARARPAPEPFPAAPSANLASSADVAAPQSVAPAARMLAHPSTTPLAEHRERAQAASEAAAAANLSQSDPLHAAAAQGDVARLRSLLQQSAPIDARDASGRTALMLAVLRGHEAVVRALLEQGADPNIGDAAGRTPLAVAREQHQSPTVKALLQAGAR